LGWTYPLQVKLQDGLFCCGLDRPLQIKLQDGVFFCGLDLSAAGKASGRFVLLWAGPVRCW
jgi:hypothetical protein